MSEGRMKLKKLKLQGFKSIPSGENGLDLDFGDVNVILGANGSGKSNLLSFFEMMNKIMNKNLQVHIGKNGYAQSFLHFGPKITKKIEAKLTFSDEKVKDSYSFTLESSTDDRMFFAEEKTEHNTGSPESSFSAQHKSGDRECFIFGDQQNNNLFENITIFKTINRIELFQFQDTSFESAMRRSMYIENDKTLYRDGSNLAPYLYRLKNDEQYKKYYDRIVLSVQMVMPHFSDFDLVPFMAGKEQRVTLNWRSIGDKPYLFSPHQISDGTLRFIALATLLLQPPEKLPPIIVIDEPELGLHPSALSVLTGMVKIASQSSQIIMATQSPRLLDEFEYDQIIIAEHKGEESQFKHLDYEALKVWFEDYCLSELWEKNVLGGKP